MNETKKVKDNWPAWKIVVAGLVCIAAISVLVGLLTTNTPSIVVHVGESGTLRYRDGKTAPVIVAVSPDTFGEYFAAYEKNDTYGQQAMERAGLIWLEDPGTHVLVLDYSARGYQQVRILDRPHAGRAGWAMTATVAP
jgi:hypothetical protein